MNIDIFYFSGTGNSLFAAKEISRQIPGSRLSPIVKSLNQQNFKIRAEVIGVIFPVHLTTIPLPVKQFLCQINFDNVKYIFIIATRMGTPHRSFTDINKILKKKNRIPDACFTLNMANNDAKFKFSQQPVSNEKIINLETIVRQKLEMILEIIKKRQPYLQQQDNEIIQKIPSFILKIIYHYKKHL